MCRRCFELLLVLNQQVTERPDRNRIDPQWMIPIMVITLMIDRTKLRFEFIGHRFCICVDHQERWQQISLQQLVDIVGVLSPALHWVFAWTI